MDMLISVSMATTLGSVSAASVLCVLCHVKYSDNMSDPEKSFPGSKTPITKLLLPNTYSDYQIVAHSKRLQSCLLTL